jgi:glycosyltransferase involved in cell wall biosynthesis
MIPSLEGGGAERQALSLILNLRKNNWDVSVILCNISPQTRKTLEKLGIEILVVGEFRILSCFGIFLKTLSFSRKKKTIINTWLSHMDVLGGLVSIVLNLNWIINERSSAKAYVSESGVYAVNPILVFLRKFLGKYSTHVIANSEEGMDYWNKIIDPFKVDFIANSIDPNQIQNYFLKESSKDFLIDVPFILSVGSLIPSKNHKTLIKAVDLLDSVNFNLLIIGDGPMKGELEQLTVNRNLQKKIIFLGRKDVWWNYLPESLGLVHASLYEGMPNVVLEAVAAKCPVILSNINAHSNILDANSALFFKSEDTSQLADMIMKLINDPKGAAFRADLAYNQISKYHSGKITKSVENIYKIITS